MSQAGEQHKRLMHKIEFVQSRFILLQALVARLATQEEMERVLKYILEDLNSAQVLAQRIDSGEFDCS